MKWNKIALYFLACLFGLLLSGNVFAASGGDTASDFSQKPLPMPTIVSPNKNTITSNRLEKITGFTISDSFLRIYIDGLYNGKTSVLKHESGTAYFSYQPFLSLSRGWHKFSVIAEYPDGRKSRAYNSEFKIEYPMPAPTLLKTVPSPKLTTKPLALGLAKNNSFVTVYVNNKYDGSFLVKNHESGTANFAYQVKAKLNRGSNKITTTAKDSRGKVSQISNALFYREKTPRISSAAFEDNTADKKEDSGSGVKVEVKKTDSLPNGIKAPDQPIDKDIKQILDGKKQATATSSGSLDENNSSQNKLKTNIIIFILLLLGIIGWIVWVNREIVKERKDSSQDDNSPPST